MAGLTTTVPVIIWIKSGIGLSSSTTPPFTLTLQWNASSFPLFLRLRFTGLPSQSSSSSS
eukprot:UN06237